MPCGNLLLTLTGEQDCYLTFRPQVALFIYVYNRHTNFAIDTLELFPTSRNSGSFGSKYSFIVPKAGDLLSKIFLKIKIPEIVLNNDNCCSISYENYLQVYRELYILIVNFVKAENTVNIDKIKNRIKTYFVNNNSLNEFKILLEKNNYYNSIFKWKDIDPLLLTDEQINTKLLLKENVEHLMYRLKLLIRKINEYSCTNCTNCTNSFNCTNGSNCTNNRTYGAWTKRLGHAIVKEISVYIGGNRIDLHDGNWLNVWYSLTKKRDIEHVYNKMIGNVKILTEYNSLNKPEYILYIPLRFWFCQYYENSLPLLCLQYNDVRIDLELNNFYNLFYTTDQNILHKYNNYPVYTSLYTNYVYLGEAEREKFATGSVDYIIDQIQIYKISTTDNAILANLDVFVHPSKEIFWTIQPKKYLKCPGPVNWNKYLQINDATIIFTSDKLTEKYPSKYYDSIQSYLHHTSSQKGIYVYSFSLDPEKLQITGSANFSVIKGPKLQINLTTNSENIVSVYSRNINILRFHSGFGQLAFTYG